MAALSEMPLVLVSVSADVQAAWDRGSGESCSPYLLPCASWSRLITVARLVQIFNECLYVPDPTQGAREPFGGGALRGRGLQSKGVWCLGVIRVTGSRKLGQVLMSQFGCQLDDGGGGW